MRHRAPPHHMSHTGTTCQSRPPSASHAPRPSRPPPPSHPLVLVPHRTRHAAYPLLSLDSLLPPTSTTTPRLHTLFTASDTCSTEPIYQLANHDKRTCDTRLPVNETCSTDAVAATSTLETRRGLSADWMYVVGRKRAGGGFREGGLSPSPHPHTHTGTKVTALVTSW